MCDLYARSVIEFLVYEGKLFVSCQSYKNQNVYIIQAQDDLSCLLKIPKVLGKWYFHKQLCKTLFFRNHHASVPFCKTHKFEEVEIYLFHPSAATYFFFPLNTQFYQQKKKKKIVSIPGGTQGQVRWGPEQPCLVGGNSAHGTGVYSPFQTQTVL